MKNRAFKVICLLLATVFLISGASDILQTEIHALEPAKLARMNVSLNEYTEYFKDFLTNEEHEYRTYRFQNHTEGDPSHFVPYLKEYGLPILSAIDGEIVGNKCLASADLSASALTKTYLEYWFYIDDVYYIVSAGFHGDAVKDYYDSLSDSKKLKYLKKEYGENDASELRPGKEEVEVWVSDKYGKRRETAINSYYMKYKTVNVGYEMQPCRVEYIDCHDGKKEIFITFIKGNFEMSIWLRDGNSYDELFDALEKIRIDIMPYSELIKSDTVNE